MSAPVRLLGPRETVPRPGEWIHLPRMHHPSQGFAMGLVYFTTARGTVWLIRVDWADGTVLHEHKLRLRSLDWAHIDDIERL